MTDTATILKGTGIGTAVTGAVLLWSQQNPLAALILMLFVLSLADWVTGVAKAQRMGVEVVSARLKTKLIELGLYCAAIAAAFAVVIIAQAATGSGMVSVLLPYVMDVVIIALCYVELVSILENLEVALGVHSMASMYVVRPLRKLLTFQLKTWERKIDEVTREGEAK